MQIGVEAEVLVAVVGLGKPVVPCRDLGFVHEDGVRVGVDPCSELVKRLLGVVRTDAGVVAVVPVVDAADEVVAADMAVGEEGAAVEAAAEEHGDPVVVADDDEVTLATRA